MVQVFDIHRIGGSSRLIGAERHGCLVRSRLKRQTLECRETVSDGALSEMELIDQLELIALERGHSSGGGYSRGSSTRMDSAYSRPPALITRISNSVCSDFGFHRSEPE
jgi:hypothetical protein